MRTAFVPPPARKPAARMLRRRLAVLMIAVTGLTLALAAQAQAADRYVPTTYPDIQSAVDASSPGDVIHVGFGVYHESVVVNTNDLTFVSLNSGVDGRLRSIGSGQESVVHAVGATPAFLIKASHVVIDGFYIRDSAPGVEWRPTTSGNSLINSIMTNNTFGIYANSNRDNIDLIRRNQFFENNFDPGLGAAGNGIYSDQGVGNLTVDQNDFLGNQNSGMNLSSVAAGTPDRDITFTGNQGKTSTDLSPLQNGVLADVTKARHVLIKGNKSTNSFSHGFYLEQSRDVAIEDNLITGVRDGWSGIRMGNGQAAASGGPVADPNQEVQIIGNTIIANPDSGGFDTHGIKVSDGGTLGPVQVHDNRFFGNGGTLGDAVQNTSADPGDVVDARDNWWGCNAGPNDGPGQCDKTSGTHVLTSPWLLLSIAANPGRVLNDGASKSKIQGDLRTNSDGDTYPGVKFPDGTLLGFTTTLGTLDAASVGTSDAAAKQNLTAPLSLGTATVGSTLDNQTVTTPVIFGPAPSVIGPAGVQGQQGVQGVQGAQGVAGQNGAPGPQGPAGPKGARGARGPRGKGTCRHRFKVVRRKNGSVRLISLKNKNAGCYKKKTKKGSHK